MRTETLLDGEALRIDVVTGGDVVYSSKES